MKTIIQHLCPFLFALTLYSPPTKAQEARAQDIRITVDPRVELMSTLFRLADAEEYCDALLPDYIESVNSYFNAFAGHDAVQAVHTLRNEASIGFNAPMGLAVYLDGVPSLKPRYVLNPIPDELDDRWTPQNIPPFLEKARRFAQESQFESFFNSHREDYKAAIAAMQTLLDKYDILTWVHNFFGARPGADFRLIIGMQNGWSNYAARVKRHDGTLELYSIIGVNTEKDGKVQFNDRVIQTVVHEFCHSYINPLVDENAPTLQRGGEKLYPFVAEKMKSLAYPQWDIMFYESLVRASVICFINDKQDVKCGQKIIQKEIALGFIWTDELVDLLRTYQANRETYPTLRAFMPRIVSFFEDYVKRAPQKLAELKAEKERQLAKIKKESPVILSMTPANGTQDVNPDLQEIRITFDRPMMNRRWTIMRDDQEGILFPEARGELAYDSTRTILIWPVRLEPGKTYQFGLNSIGIWGFRDAQGHPLYPVQVRFKTSGVSIQQPE